MTAGNQPSSSGSAPVVKSFTGSTKNDRCLEVWFADEVTDETRAWLLEAINEKALRGAAQAAPEPDADLEHVRSALATLSDPLTIAVDGHLTGTARALAIVHAMRDIAATAALHLSAVTPSPGARSWTPDQFWEYVSGLAGEFEAGQMRDMLAAKGLSITSTTCAGAVTKHSGTFLGYRDEHGNEMHCAHAFCPHQAKCHKGCTNPVAMTSTDRGGGK